MLEEILSTSSDFVNTENSKSYKLDKENCFREPGSDDGPVSSSLPFWVQPDLSFDPSSFIYQVPPRNKQLDLNYLDNNAQVGGSPKSEIKTDTLEEESEKLKSELWSLVHGEMARSKLCLRTAAHFDGTKVHEDNSVSLFHHVLNCRKPWCEVCGGKQGVIAKTRKRAIFKRFKPTNYGMRQFVFTVPMEIRPFVQSRTKQNSLFEDAKQVTAKYFGDPEKTKRNPKGKVKSYCFGDKLAIGYLHVFGDPDKDGQYRKGDAGTFHPHVNVQVFEESENLHLTQETLKQMRSDWAVRLKKYGKFNGEVDIHYLWLSRSAKARKKLHKIKYMVKPYLQENIFKVLQDGNLELLELLTIDMKGFQFLRFWGGLANAKKAFRDEAGIYPEELEELQDRLDDRLIFRSITEWDVKSYLEKDKERIAQGKKPRLKRQAENFYEERIGVGNE